MLGKTLISLCAILLLVSAVSNAQEKLIVEGALTLGNSETMTPDSGTVRWTGTDFEGYTGSRWVSLTSGPCGGLSFVKDVDANTYPTVAIGSQCWTAVNLKTENYNDGTAIPLVNSGTDWGAVTTPAYSWYNDNSGNAMPFGALYNWYAVDMGSNGNRNVCPSGWHMPTEQDFSTLQTFLGGESTAGIPMKEAGSVHFLDDNETATNESGFTAIPGGYRSGSSFIEKGYYAQYWTSTPNSATQAKFLDLEYDGEYADISIQNKNRGNSIRCIKD